MDSIARIVHSFEEWNNVKSSTAGEPIRLACHIEDGATSAEIAAAPFSLEVPDEMLSFWRQARSARLFEDINYGQWGLRILSPVESADRTAVEHRDRPQDLSATDLVIGEFLGDQELLVLALDEDLATSEVVIALPLDPREAWPSAGCSLANFLDNYLAATGDQVLGQLMGSDRA